MQHRPSGHANGIDSVVLRMTFIDELLGIPFESTMTPTRCWPAGRRIALPVWLACFQLLGYESLRLALRVGWLCAIDRDVHYVEVVEVGIQANVETWRWMRRKGRRAANNQLKALEAGEVVRCSPRDLKLLYWAESGRVQLLKILRSRFNQLPSGLHSSITHNEQTISSRPRRCIVGYIST